MSTAVQWAVIEACVTLQVRLQSVRLPLKSRVWNCQKTVRRIVFIIYKYAMNMTDAVSEMNSKKTS